MLSLHEALEIIQEVKFNMPSEQVDLTDSWNCVLCEDVISDIDMPPFDKSAMDGYACRFADLQKDLELVGTVQAGETSDQIVNAGTCIKIMTGAPIPAGADTVIMIEDTELVSDKFVHVKRASTKRNICLLGEDVKKGDKLLKSGELLQPHKLAVLASAGYAKIRVSKKPRVALVSTGSELVGPGQYPGLSQIRNSNAYNLQAQLSAMGIEARGGAKDRAGVRLFIRFRLLFLTTISILLRVSP